jgi:tyrosyl-tRNA synthetase
MSKSAGNAPWLDAQQTSPYEYYQYWRNTEDADVVRFMRMFTFLSLEEIAEYERLSGAELNRAKEVLAFEATKITHGIDEAERAQRTARARFGGDGADTDEGPSVSVREPTRLSDLAVQAGLVDSRNAAKRYLQSGALKLDDVAQTTDRLVDPNELPKMLSLGKRKVRLTPGS